MRFVNRYHDDAGYIEALAQRVLAHWQTNGRGDKLVLSFHGVPKRTLLLGDPYHCECLKTARLLGERLSLKADQLLVTFQSRFGKAEWLQPYTEPTLVELAKQGVARVDLMCPGFTADCLETLEEIDQEARQAFLEAGGARVPLHPLPQRQPCLDRGAGRPGHPPPAGLADEGGRSGRAGGAAPAGAGRRRDAVGETLRARGAACAAAATGAASRARGR